MRPFFRLENVELNFAGFENTLGEYASVDYENLPQVFSVARSLLLWVDYLEELLCVINTCSMKLENRQLYLEAFLVEHSKSSKINTMIEETYNQKRLCDFYKKELLIQIKFLNLAYKYVVREYDDHILT